MDLACRTETSCSRAPGPMNMSCVDERCGFPEGTPDDFRYRAAIARPTCASSTAGKGKGRARLDPGRQPLRLEPDICNLPRNPAEVNQRCLYKGMPPKLSKETRTPLHNLSWPVARAIAFDARSNGHARRCQSQHSETSQKSRGSPRVSVCVGVSCATRFRAWRPCRRNGGPCRHPRCGTGCGSRWGLMGPGVGAK
jgi:hypothetical protein